MLMVSPTSRTHPVALADVAQRHDQNNRFIERQSDVQSNSKRIE